MDQRAASSARTTARERRPEPHARGSLPGRAAASSRGRRRSAPAQSASALLVEATRGGRVESVHRGSVAVLSPSGELLASAGDPDQFVFLRSAAKPFQLAPFVASRHLDEYRLGTEAIAIMAASHSGEDRHVRLVQEILRGAGLTSSVLQNQVHAPLDRETARRLVRDGEEPTVLRGNCSGKHAGMVLFAKAAGWPIETYWHRDHPVQRLALDAISTVSDVPRDEIVTAVDGCGVVCFGMPLRGLATAFARLADPSTVSDVDLSQALFRIRDAMMAHPELVAGERRRLDTTVMRAYPRRVVSKGGADGVLAMGLPPGALSSGAPFGDGPIGIAAKLDDGDLGRRAGDVLGVALLRAIGLAVDPLPPGMEGLVEPAITDPRGEVSGSVRSTLKLA